MSQDNVMGLRCRVTIPIADGAPGEVMLDLPGGWRAYTAYAAGESIPKNAHAVVIEQTGPQTVMVTATDV